jgi:hypothetical protein
VKVIIDENLPPALAGALNALFSGEHEIRHLRERFGPAVQDVDWIRALNEEGGWIIISGDRRITRSRAEYHAFRTSRLVGFFLSKGLNKAKLTKKMERLMALWETIETQAMLVQGGAMFVLPMKSTRLQQLR